MATCPVRRSSPWRLSRRFKSLHLCDSTLVGLLKGQGMNVLSHLARPHIHTAHQSGSPTHSPCSPAGPSRRRRRSATLRSMLFHVPRCASRLESSLITRIFSQILSLLFFAFHHQPGAEMVHPWAQAFQTLSSVRDMGTASWMI